MEVSLHREGAGVVASPVVSLLKATSSVSEAQNQGFEAAASPTMWDTGGRIACVLSITLSQGTTPCNTHHAAIFPKHPYDSGVFGNRSSDSISLPAVRGKHPPVRYPRVPSHQLTWF